MSIFSRLVSQIMNECSSHTTKPAPSVLLWVEWQVPSLKRENVCRQHATNHLLPLDTRRFRPESDYFMIIIQSVCLLQVARVGVRRETRKTSGNWRESVKSGSEVQVTWHVTVVTVKIKWYIDRDKEGFIIFILHFMHFTPSQSDHVVTFCTVLLLHRRIKFFSLQARLFLFPEFLTKSDSASLFSRMLE